MPSPERRARRAIQQRRQPTIDRHSGVEQTPAPVPTRPPEKQHTGAPVLFPISTGSAAGAAPAAPPSVLSSDSSTSGPPHYAEGDPMAQAVVAQIADCSLSDQWALLHAVRGAGLGASGERVQLCRVALAACAADSESQSKGGYSLWRNRQPLPEQWPSTQYIESTFGSWRRARAAAGSDVVLDTLARHPGVNTRPLSDEEICDALREYAATDQPLVWRRYQQWARERMRDAGRRLERYVRTRDTVLERFGSWVGALTAAGLGPRLVAERGVADLRHGAQVDYTVERCHLLLRQAFAAELLGSGPAEDSRRFTKVRYREWADAHERSELLAGRWVAVPAAQTIVGLCGSWAAALHGAGLIDRGALHARRRLSTVKRSNEELIAAVRDAFPQDGSYVTHTEYSSYRDRRGPVDGQWLPTCSLIKQRLGWREANRLAVLLDEPTGEEHDGARRR